MTAAGDPYDLVVLGGGSAGYSAALRAAESGLGVAIVERDRLGGTCLHRGCIPTKALLHAAEIADTVREAGRVGIKANVAGIDPGAIASYRSGVVDRLHSGLRHLIAERRIELVGGDGTLVSPTSIRVADRVLTGRHVLLATGSRPTVLPGLAPDGERVLTSDQALMLDEIPTDVIILGGGVIGVEFASAWRSLGAEVTVIEAMPRLLPAEEESSSAALARAFRRRGIRTELGTAVDEVKVGDADVTVTLIDGRTISAERLLVAIGRTPAAAELDLQRFGIGLDRSAVAVDALCRTSVDTVSAAGDLIATPQLAHVGFAEGLLVAERIVGGDPQPIDYSGVPRVSYCHPEVASVGLTTTQAQHQGYAVTTVRYDLAGNGKNLILGGHGAVTVVAADQGPVLGVHIVGERACELIAEAQLIVNWEARPDEVARHLHPHPTLSEAIGEAHLALAGTPLHAHR